MTAEEIREINCAGQRKALETASKSQHEAALDSLKISILSEIAAQLAELVVEQRRKNDLLGESISLQRDDMTDRIEHNTNVLKIFTTPKSESSV